MWHMPERVCRQRSLVVVNAPGSSAMAWGGIFLARVRSTEPLRADDTCQHEGILYEHVEQVRKRRLPSSQSYVFQNDSVKYKNMPHGKLYIILKK